MLRIAVVQFAPKLGEVHANIAKARELCRGLTPRSVDLVCFPEMIFTGYMFPDAPSIAPYLEHPKTGPTASFCTDLARRLGCVVVAGYPERLPPSPSSSSSSSPSPSPSVPSSSPFHTPTPIGANAALVCNDLGHLVHTYHKSNLFPTDQTWARPGPGFTALDLPLPIGRIGVAICNDLNVHVGVDGDRDSGWVSIEHGPYELAAWCQREKVSVVVLLNAWLRPEDGGMEGVEDGDRHGGERDSVVVESREDGEMGEEGEDALEPNWCVLNYWAWRLRPLWAASDARPGDGESSKVGGKEVTRSDEQRDVIVVVCNRFGRERGKTFAGSSAMFVMRPGSGRPRLLHVMGEREEGVCVWTASVGSQTRPS